MLVKQKLKIYEKEKISQIKNDEINPNNEVSNKDNKLSEHASRMGKL